jgi:HEAT repeat protein
VETEGEEAIDALVDLLGSDDRTVKDEAIDALVKIGDPAISHIIEASGDPAKREAAIIVMEGLREKILMRQAVMRREGSSS